MVAAATPKASAWLPVRHCEALDTPLREGAMQYRRLAPSMRQRAAQGLHGCRRRRNQSVLDSKSVLVRRRDKLITR